MSELTPAPFAQLVTRLFAEPAHQETLFDLPRRLWLAPAEDDPDWSVEFDGKVAGNPFGPAAGPHTQMAQNILLSYVGGARIMELKTVQVNDRLEIPRPCIDMANVGYNVEWSQELRTEESLREYVAGSMLIEIFRQIVAPSMGLDWSGRAGAAIFDTSVGYDLAGIRSDKVQRFLDQMLDASDCIEQLRSEIPKAYAAARRLEFPPCISDSITLSTFHGCPPEEIEKICEFLIAERELHVVVKMNPPMLGRERLEYLLHDKLGYTEITVPDAAYQSGLPFDEGLELCERMTNLAQSHGRQFGVKFSNTLEVVNHREVFDRENKTMYLSGQPLHVITMALCAAFREQASPHLPISFSAGVDKTNFADVVACGFVPVTASTDLLRTSGYGRIRDYFKNLKAAMAEVEAKTLDQFILRRFGHEAKAREAALAELEAHHVPDAIASRWAGVYNTSELASQAAENPRYHADSNRKPPKRIDSQLELFDCITCNKCIPVCPNDANFTFPVPEGELSYHDYWVEIDGSLSPDSEQQTFALKKKMQIANFADFCNECGNCDTFCPEYGGPYIMKPTFFGSREHFEACGEQDGFYLEQAEDGYQLTGRLEGITQSLRYLNDQSVYYFHDGMLGCRVAQEGYEPQALMENQSAPGERHSLSMGRFHALRTLAEGVLDRSQLHAVNLRWWDHS